MASPEETARAADFAVRFIPIAVKIRKAKDDGTGLTLSPEETRTLVEVLQVLRQGPK